VDRRYRLTRSTDFKKVKESGNVYFHPVVKMAAKQNSLPGSRFGIIASKYVGNAVVRNRCKRRLRAVLNLLKDDCVPGWDIVFIIHSRMTQSSPEGLQAAVKDLLTQAGLLMETRKN